MFNRISAVILLVSNMEKSIEFYKDVLGMEVKQQAEDWVEFSKHGTVLALHPTKEKNKEKFETDRLSKPRQDSESLIIRAYSFFILT
jgi:catechol 2,3-dioxygenase-like lactoylglutathione lyase family enzyme